MNTLLAARLDRLATAAAGLSRPRRRRRRAAGGEVLLRHAWGYANAERRIAFTPRHAVPHVLDHQAIHLRGGAGRLSPTRPCWTPMCRPAAALEQPAPALHLAHNQSGLRDYWAVAMLQARRSRRRSAMPRPPGHRRHPQPAIRAGHAYSYVNQNFRLLSDIAAGPDRPRASPSAAHRVFDRVGMAERLPGRRYARHAGRHRGLRGHVGPRLSRRGEPHPVDRRCRARRQPRRMMPGNGISKRRGTTRIPLLAARGARDLRRRRAGAYGFGLGRGPMGRADHVAMAARCAAGAATGCTCRRAASRSWCCSTTWRCAWRGDGRCSAAALGGERPSPACRAARAGLARRRISSRRPAFRAHRAARRAGAAALRPVPDMLDLQPDGAAGTRASGCARATGALDGPPRRTSVRLLPGPRRARGTSSAATAARNWTPN